MQTAQLNVETEGTGRTERPDLTHRRWGLSAIGVLAVCMATNAFAQSTDQAEADLTEIDGAPFEEQVEPLRGAPPTLDEVVVTATKRADNIRDIAGSVGAVSGTQLEELKAQGLEDYLKFIPGVTVAQEGVDDSVPVIRGIATSTDRGFTALSVGIYLDDMPFQDLVAPLSVPNLNPFDLERVEVLKGPQGVLFGTGALSGAVRYITHKPEVGEWAAKAQYLQSFTAEGGPTYTGAAAINVPLGDNAAVRLMGLKRSYGGLYDVNVKDDATGETIRKKEDADAFEQETYRAAAKWDVTDTFTVGAMYFTQETDQEDSLAFADQRSRMERSDGPFDSPRFSSFGGFNAYARYTDDLFDVFYTGNLLEKETYTTTHAEAGLGLGNQSAVEFPNTIAGEVDGMTHEIRISSSPDWISPWSYLVGYSHLSYDQFIFQYVYLDQTGARGPQPKSGDEVSQADRISSQLFAEIDTEATESAFFGELTREFGEKWEASVGLRYFETELHSDTLLTGAQIVALTGQTENRNQFDLNSEGVTPKFTFKYHHNENVQLYGVTAKGFQFGGVQLNPPAQLFTLSADNAGFDFGPYESSDLISYELGVRTEWFERRLRVDFAAYYMDWKDLQLTIAVPLNQRIAVPLPGQPDIVVVPAVTFSIVENVGAAHAQGAELVLEMLPFSWLKVNSAVSYLEAEIDEEFDADNEAGPVPAGTRLPGAPRWQFANMLTTHFALPFDDGAWQTTMMLSHVYMGEASDNIREVETVGDYHSFDFKAMLSRPIGNVLPVLTVGVNNVFDKRGVSANAGSGDLKAISFIQPRTFVVSADISF